MKDLITSIASFSRENCLKCNSVYCTVLSSIMDPAVSNSSTPRRSSQSGLGAVHTLSTSLYLWQVVWHLQSEASWSASLDNLLPKEGRGLRGWRTKKEGGCVGGSPTSFRLPSKPPFTILPHCWHLTFLCLAEKLTSYTSRRTPLAWTQRFIHQDCSIVKPHGYMSVRSCQTFLSLCLFSLPSFPSLYLIHHEGRG